MSDAKQPLYRLIYVVMAHSAEYEEVHGWPIRSFASALAAENLTDELNQAAIDIGGHISIHVGNYDAEGKIYRTGEFFRERFGALWKDPLGGNHHGYWFDWFEVELF